MHSDHEIFIQAIRDEKKVIINHRNDDGYDIRTKIYQPLFYDPDSSRNGDSRYYFWESVSGPKGSIVKIKTEHIIRMGPTQESFGPAGFKLDEKLSNLPNSSGGTQ